MISNGSEEESSWCSLVIFDWVGDRLSRGLRVVGCRHYLCAVLMQARFVYRWQRLLLLKLRLSIQYHDIRGRRHSEQTADEIGRVERGLGSVACFSAGHNQSMVPSYDLVVRFQQNRN